MSTSTPKRPLLRYFGGKWQLRHWIIEHLPEHDFYAEPFAGAASVLLAKPPAPKGEIINDLNQDVVNLFRVMQDRASADELERRLAWTPYARAEFHDASCASDDPIERARQLVIRSFMGIGTAGAKSSVYSFKTGFRMGNVSLRNLAADGKGTFRNCAKDWANWREELEVIRQRLAHVMIYERPALEFIDLMDAHGCLLYVDPPYTHSERSKHRYDVEFTDHDALAQRLLQCKAMVVLSGYPTERYAPLETAGWKRVEKDYRANMSERRRTECLWISPNAQTQPMLTFSTSNEAEKMNLLPQ